MKNKLVLICFYLFLLFGIKQAWAATETLQSVASADGYATDQFGVNNSSGLTVGDHSDNTSYRSFVHFDLSVLPPGATAASITAAVLRVYQDRFVTGSPYTELGGGVIVDHVAYPLPLIGLTYNVAPLQANMGTISDNATEEWKTLNVTARVLDDLNNGRTTSQYRLRFPDPTDSNADIDWTTFEDGDGSRGTGNLPELVITYGVGGTAVPTLSTLGLVVLGSFVLGVGVVAVRRGRA